MYLSVSQSVVSLRVASVRFQLGLLLEVGGKFEKKDNKVKYLFKTKKKCFFYQHLT